jgi:hypothetical protein
MRRAFLFTTLGAIVFVACVGDEPSTDIVATDAGADATTDATTGSDGSIGDAATDAPTGTTCDPTKPFGAAVSLDALNAGNTSADIRLTADGLFAFYDALAADAGGNTNIDIFQASRATLSADFSAPVDIAGLGGNNSIDTPTITGDGLFLYYTYKLSGVNAQIGLATRANNTAKFSIPTPTPVDPPVDGNSDASFLVFNADPFIRQDGQELYFVSDRLMQNRFDIFRAASAGDGGFVSATELTELGNTHAERAPVVSPDGLLLYYSTNLQLDGGAESNWTVYRASRATTSASFSNIARVDELAIDQDTFPSYVTADLCTIYLHRAAAGGAATSLLYKATKTP